MRRRLILVAVLVGLGFLTSTGRGQDIVTLTSPITTANITNARLERLIVDFPAQSVTVQWRLRDASNNTLSNGSASYPTPAVNNVCGSPSLQPSGATLLHTVNTANFTTNSLSKQIFLRLQADCYLPAGAISGAPD